MRKPSAGRPAKDSGDPHPDRGSRRLTDLIDSRRDALLDDYEGALTMLENAIVADRGVRRVRDSAPEERPGPAASDRPWAGPQPPGGAGIERALSEAMHLIDNALAEHRSVGGEQSVLELSDSDEAAALTVKRLVSEARRELICVGTPERMTHGPLRPAAEALRAPSGATAPMRVLFPVRGGDDRHRVRALLPGDGRNQSRVTEARLQEMVLADRRTGLLISQFGPDQWQTLIIRSQAILTALHALFLHSWESAAPMLPVSLLDDPRQCEKTRLILASLSEGQTDDVAARELGISVRTYRKYVADFMRDINATSRFQAGVRAAQLRLLPAS
ncbi:hypothetical protein [Kitasatospora sp. NPDC058218]|uniref:hypothetical protein n=1 Tax=Kitasatospora sp. NPDC058218 TaxID=3346385 RepID=UPI0036D8812F